MAPDIEDDLPKEKDGSARLKETYDGSSRDSNVTDPGHAPLPGACEELPSSEDDSSSEDEEALDSDESFGGEELSDVEESWSEEDEEDDSVDEDDDSEGDNIPDSSLGKRKRSKKNDRSLGDDDSAQKYVCAECGFKASKPALLTQHMRSHSDQRSFTCPESGCSCSYKRQDHLNRHMKKHEGISFPCTHPGCKQTFTVQGNLRRHLKHHEENPNFPLNAKTRAPRTYSCKFPGCGKVCRYPSFLRTHEENVHGKLRHAELYCIYPGCGDKFSNAKELLKHADIAHPYLLCEVCGENIARRSFIRHARKHATREPCDVVCPYDECGKSYTRERNLKQHIRSVHLQLKPYICSIGGCGQKFAHKASQERHEMSNRHAPPRHDFEEQDQLHLARPRGGRRRFSFDGRRAQDLLL